MRTLKIQLPDDLERDLEEEARFVRKRDSEVAREALTVYLEDRRRERLMDDFIRAARALAQDTETLAVSEEFLPLDNEALDLAEGGWGRNR